MPKNQDDVPQTVRPEDLPKPVVEHRSRNYRRRECPICGKGCYRDNKGKRILHDVGDPRSGRPHDIEVIYSKHRCEKDKRYFNVDMSDLALPGCCYTHRVMSLALRLVIEDGLPLRTASWHLWRDHRVYVPFGTICNWLEEAGKKRRKSRR